MRKGLPFEAVTSVAVLDAHRRSADGAPVLLDIRADSAPACRRFESEALADTRVLARLREFVLLNADVDVNAPTNHALIEHLRVRGAPSLIFFDGRTGEERGRLVGAYSAEDLLSLSLSLLARYAA